MYGSSAGSARSRTHSSFPHLPCLMNTLHIIPNHSFPQLLPSRNPHPPASRTFRALCTLSVRLSVRGPAGGGGSRLIRLHSCRAPGGNDGFVRLVLQLDCIITRR